MLGILLSATLALFSCGGSDSGVGKVVITGNLQNAPEGVVVLSQYTDSRPKVLDTLEIKSNGDFTFEFDQYIIIYKNIIPLSNAAKINDI